MPVEIAPAPNALIRTACPVFFALLAILAASGAQALEIMPFSSAASSTVPAPWRFIGLPERYVKPLSAIDVFELDGTKVLRLRTDASWGTVAHPITGQVKTLQFAWRLDKPLMRSNLKTKATEDAALKVCLSFDMPIDRVPVGERLLFRLAQLLSRDKLPTATLCYAWAYADSQGMVVPSPVTSRVRYLILNSAADPLQTWQAHTRNVNTDFLKVFGAESLVTPAVTAIVIGADSDNTQDTSLGYVSDIVVGRAGVEARP